MSTPQTDIVIPVHGALEYLSNCVATVDQHTENFRYIFVDDYSDATTSDWLCSRVWERPNALYIRTGKQKWFTRASNLGLRLVKTDRAVLLNSDCVVDKGWLEELYAVWDAAEQDPVLSIGARKVGLVGACLSGEEPRRWAPTQEPNYVTGHCLLLNMSAITAVSIGRGTPGWYFDEKRQDAIHINSDKYLSWELNRLQYHTIASFKAPVGHHFGKSWGCNLAQVFSRTLEEVD